MSQVETVAEAFSSYRQAVIPHHAPPVQVEECRRAFYAGSYTMLMNISANIGDDSTSEENGIVQLEALKAECEAFAASVGQPRPTIMEQTSYNVRSDVIESALRELATQIKPQVPDGFGFTLMIFSYGPTGLAKEGPAGSMFYISSAQREDMIQAMKEFIGRHTQ
jgi:hypothetical protein